MEDVLLTIKCRGIEYIITEKDKFLDNGACVQLISQKGPFVGWDYSNIVVPKKEVKRINKFEKIQHRSDKGLKVFSVRRGFK